MAGIYISCRHADSRQFVGRLNASLAGAFGAGFIVCRDDERAIGDDLAGELSRQLAAIDIVLVLIGADWLNASRDGRRCLDDPADRVRSEIALALLAGKRVWPVLLDAAELPAAESLPADLHALLGAPTYALADARWREDVARLCGALRSYMTPPNCKPRWEFFAALGVLVVTLFEGEAWVEREAALLAARTEPVAGDADLAARPTVLVAYPAGAGLAEPVALCRAGDDTAGYLSHIHLVEEVRPGEGGRRAFATRNEAPAADGRRLALQPQRGQASGERLPFVLETTAGEALDTSLAFVAWPGAAAAPGLRPAAGATGD